MRRLVSFVLLLAVLAGFSLTVKAENQQAEGPERYSVMLHINIESHAESQIVDGELITVAGELMIGLKTLNKLDERFELFNDVIRPYSADNQGSHALALTSNQYDRVLFRVGDSNYRFEQYNLNYSGEFNLALAPLEYEGDIYLPLMLFESLNYEVEVRNGRVIFNMRDISTSSILKSIQFEGLQFSPSYRSSISQYSYTEEISAPVKVTVNPLNPETKVYLDGKLLQNFVENVVSLEGKNRFYLKSVSQNRFESSKYNFIFTPPQYEVQTIPEDEPDEASESPMYDMLEVYGKVLSLNDQVIQTNVLPKVVAGSTYLPLVDTLNAFGYPWKFNADKTAVSVDYYGRKLSMKAKLMDGSRMLLLSDIKKMSKVTISVKNPPVSSKRTVPAAEKKARSEYESAVKSLAAAQTNYDAANKKYRGTLADDPVFYINGDIISRDPFIVWGKASSPSGLYNHPAVVASRNSGANLLVEDPDMFGAYHNSYSGAHYFKGTTTGIADGGQVVVVYIFGARSVADTKQNKTAKAALDKASATLEKSEDNVKDKKSKLTLAVQNHYDAAIKKAPKNAQLYYAYARALADTALALKIQIPNGLWYLADTKAVRAGNLKSEYFAYYDLYIADLTLSKEDDKVKAYIKAVDSRPEAGLNYCETAQQYWILGRALERLKLYAQAAFAYNQASLLGDAKMKVKADKKYEAVSDKICRNCGY